MGDHPGASTTGDSTVGMAEKFLHQLSDPAVLFTQNRQVVAANKPAADLLSRSVKELLGRGVGEIFKLDQGEEQALLEADSGWLQLKIPPSDPCMAFWTSLPAETSREDCFLMVLADCKPAEALIKLEQVRKSQDDFIYSISHDLRAPLRAIQGFSSLLKQELEGKASDLAQTYLQRMVAAADRMDAFMNDLLVLSRITRTEVLLRPIELGGIIESIKNELIQGGKHRDATIELKGKLHPVAGMTTLCQHALRQVLHNALTYVSAGTIPRVEVSSEENSNIQVVISDNGMGVKPEHHEKILKAFERLHSSDSHPGTGLGLTIVKAAMEKMEGSVQVQSDGVHGSRFILGFRKVESLKPLE